MPTLRISLPEALASFVRAQTAARGYRTSEDYIRQLISAERARQHLRELLLAGAASPLAAVADTSYFNGLRDRIRQAKTDQR